MTTSTLADPRVGKARLINYGPAGADRDLHNRYVPKLEAAVAKLSRLETAEEMAQFFKAEGITGQAAHASKCPVAQWLQREIGSPRVRVSATISIGHANGTTTVMDSPTVVGDFFRAFDKGAFPYLRKAIPGCLCWLCGS